MSDDDFEGMCIYTSIGFALLIIIATPYIIFYVR